jgi:hypothetical protein
MTNDLDQRLLPQAPPVEGAAEGSRPRPISYEIHREALAIGAQTTITFRERFDYIRVSVFNSAPVAADTIAVIFNPGSNVFTLSAVQLADGGTIRLPMAENSFTFQNIGSKGVIIVAIAVNGFDDDYYPGVTLT